MHGSINKKMAREINIDINLMTRQAQANAQALSRSSIGLANSITGILSAVELASRAFSALGAAFSGTIGSSIELQASVAEVTTLLNNQIGIQEQLESQVLSLQRLYGGDQAVIAKGFYDAISSGAVDASDAVELLNVANKLAVGGVTDVNTAVNGLTTIINSYGLSAKDSLQISDTLFSAMKTGEVCPFVA